MKSQEDAGDHFYGDKISTVDGVGKRKWIYALQPKGKIYTLRKLTTWLYLIIFFSLPVIKIDGHPLFLFDFTKSTFIFFGKIFFAQDSLILGIGMLVILLFIIVFTLAFGRVFCGWACPQTIFLEMIFRRIEYWIEGPAHIQKKNDKQPWTTALWIKKISKHIIFFLLSFLIANTFLAYIISLDELIKIITSPVSEHIAGFLAIIGFTTVFYLVFAYVREIVCTVVCPYGRLQSVLLDKNSINVSYDYVRGEPRGKRSKNHTEAKGDCIDCKLCVHVCPTGIDIRDGVQMECINCTACIDACNMMMEKVNLPLGLIRYASENNIAEKSKTTFNFRMKMYSGVLAGLLTVLIIMLATRTMFDATILRVPGQILQENADGTISNLYRIKIVNKSWKTEPYHLQITEQNASITHAGKRLDSLTSGLASEEIFFIKIPAQDLQSRKNKVHVQVMSGNKVITTEEVSFIGQY